MGFNFRNHKRTKKTNTTKGASADLTTKKGQPKEHLGFYKRVSFEKYQSMVDFFRRRPGQLAACARAHQITRDTAHRYWHKGNKVEGWPAIKEFLKEEKAQARAALATSLSERLLDDQDWQDKVDLELSRIQAVNTSVEEGRMVALSRAATSELQVALVKLSPGVQKLVEAINNELQIYAETEVIDLDKAFTILRRYASVIKDANSAAQLAMEMERLHLGQPTSHLGIHLDGDDLSMEDAAAEVEAAAAALKRAKASGILDKPDPTKKSPLH